MSHHGNDNPNMPEFMKKMLEHDLKDMQRKIHGEFPHGRFNASDEGALAMSIGHSNGKVIMEFAVTTKWIGFTPDQAVEVAQLIITHAKQISNKPITINIT